MFFSKALSCFLFLQLVRQGSAQAPTACLTRAECDNHRQELGFDRLHVGKFPTKGCFSKGGNAYFGLGGSDYDRSESPLSGEMERIWCNASDSQPTTKKTTKAAFTNDSNDSFSSFQLQITCLTQKECDMKRQELGFTKILTGNYHIKGCFSKGDTAYFGMGGTLEHKSESPLSGLKERIWCGTSSNNQVESPTNSPTAPITFIKGGNSGDNCIDIQVNTDSSGKNTGFKLSTNPEDNSTPNTLLDFPVGSLKSESEYVKQVCVSEGTYTLTVNGRASYSARIDDEEVLYGRNPTGNPVSHNILAGKDATIRANMNDDEKEWLDEHNTRREAFHIAQGTEYRRLQWSPELAKDASDWVDELTPDCKTRREPNVDEGENLSVKKYNSERDNERPANILHRWSDLNPGKQTMTQVMWRATRHVGCSNKEVVNDDGTRCYVSVCRYSRPGNCSLGSFASWQAATRVDRTYCGRVCPDDGCH